MPHLLLHETMSVLATPPPPSPRQTRRLLPTCRDWMVRAMPHLLLHETAVPHAARCPPSAPLYDCPTLLPSQSQPRPNLPTCRDWMVRVMRTGFHWSRGGSGRIWGKGKGKAMGSGAGIREEVLQGRVQRRTWVTERGKGNMDGRESGSWSHKGVCKMLGWVHGNSNVAY